MAQADLQRTWSSRVVSLAPMLTGLLLALLTVVALLALGWYEFQETLAADTERGELQARVLNDHAARSVDSAGLALGYLARQFETTDILGAGSRADQMLSQALVALPFIRSLHVVDATGLVLASSAPYPAGRIAIARLGELPQAGQAMLGQFIAGRGLEALVAGNAAPPVSAGLGFIPFIRAGKGAAGLDFFVVALLNPDSFSSFQLLTLNDPQGAAYLLSYKGDVLASSGEGALLPGASLANHTVFRDYLPGTEHASYAGVGARPDRQVVAFRLSKARPLVVIVERPFAASVRRWLTSVRWFGAAGAVVVVFLAFMSFAVQRSMRAREAVHGELNMARLDLVQRERELRVLVKSVQELIFRTDSLGAITYVNDRWVAMRGQGVETAKGRPLTALVERSDREAVVQLFSPDSGAGVRTATASMRSSDGVLRRFDIAVVPLRDVAGIVGFAGSAVDVTERFAAEQALQHQLSFVALLLEISPLPVATFDAVGRYVSVNRAWEDFMGQARTQVIGQRGTHFMSEADAAVHAARDAELWRNGGSLRYEAKVNHRDGSRRDVVVTKVVVPGDDYHSAGFLSTMMDVSEFREAERATREAKDAAEEASRAKSEFIANISHELRTPLQSILGFSELGVTRGREQPRLQGMFKEIHASGTRMLALVSDLLDVSKIESAVGAITPERADLRGLVDPVLQELSPLLAAKQLRLVSGLGDLPLLAKVDPVRFQQVVRNVVANAIKFSPAGAEIAVRGEVTAEQFVCISVRDHGVGIPPAELEAIFEAFVQSSTTKDGSGGTGLGLAICKKILAAHAGYIEADNMPDGGAVFRICLPMRHHLDRDTNYAAL